MGRRLANVAASWLLIAAITLVGLEIGLRVAPGLIPEPVLRRFEASLRTAIAKRRFLPHESQSRLLERDDDGPPLKVLLPNARIEYSYRDIDLGGSLVMDGLGFSNAPENDYRLPEVDIIAIGDSFTVPTPPRQELCWPAQLGRMTGRSLYALSRGSMGPYEYVQLLKHFGLAKRPKIVVMQIYGGNDLRDAIYYHRWAAASPEERAHVREERSRTFALHPFLDNSLGRNSYAYDTLVVATAIGVSELASLLDPASRIDFRYRLEFPDGSVEMNVENGDLDEVRNARRLRANDTSLTVFDAALASYAALAREHGFVPVVSYAPSAYSAYAEFVAFHDDELEELMLWFCDSQREHLARKSAELGLVFVDLTPAMREAASRLLDDELLYYPISIHYAPAGHRTAAAAVAEALAAHAAPDAGVGAGTTGSTGSAGSTGGTDGTGSAAGG